MTRKHVTISRGRNLQKHYLRSKRNSQHSMIMQLSLQSREFWDINLLICVTVIYGNACFFSFMLILRACHHVEEDCWSSWTWYCFHLSSFSVFFSMFANNNNNKKQNKTKQKLLSLFPEPVVLGTMADTCLGDARILLQKTLDSWLFIPYLFCLKNMFLYSVFFFMFFSYATFYVIVKFL